jgi:hypothetical protein
MNSCHAPGCRKQGVIYLETVRFEPRPQREETHWYCVEHAEQQEEAIEKENKTLKQPGDRLATYGFCRRKEAIPVVGMPATEHVGSDSYPCTVIDVSRNGKKVKVQRNPFKAAPGSDYFTNQKWVIDPEPSGETIVFTLRKNGRWIMQGGAINCGCSLGLGFRRASQDPHF